MLDGRVRRLRPNRLGAAVVAVLVVVPTVLAGLVLVAMGIWERSLDGPVRLLPIGGGLALVALVLAGFGTLVWRAFVNPDVVEVSPDRLVRRGRDGTEVVERASVRSVEVHWSTGKAGGVDRLCVVGCDGSVAEWPVDWWVLVSVRKVLRTLRTAGWPVVDFVRSPFSPGERLRSGASAPPQDA